MLRLFFGITLLANLLLYRLSTVLEQILLLDILIKATLSKKREHFYLFQQNTQPFSFSVCLTPIVFIQTDVKE